jgi:hypothetical protein
MERIKLKTDVGVKCDRYQCSDSCPLHDIEGGFTVGFEISEPESETYYSTCAVTLIWAEFYGLY